MSASDNNYDTLYGLSTVARFVHLTEDEAERLIEAGELPAFRIGKVICGSKVDLRSWRKKRERQQ